MSPGDEAQGAAWLQKWMHAAAQEGAMSQRKLSAITLHGGGLEAAVQAARDAGLHLVLLVDDRGEQVVAASRHPFTVLV